MLLIEGDRPVYAAPAIHLSPKHARSCARRVNKRRSRRTQTCRWEPSPGCGRDTGGRVGCLPFDEQFVLLDKLKRLVDLSGVFVRAQPGRLRDAVA